MKKLIIVLMVFTTLFCYSQDNFKNTEKKVSKEVSLEQFKELKQNVNKLIINNKKLQNEKNVLERKFQAKQIAFENKINKRDLTTEQIAEKAHEFYWNAFFALLALLALLGVAFPVYMNSQQRKTLRKEKDDMLKRVNDTSEKFKTDIDNAINSNKELEKKIDKAVHDNKKLENKLENIVSDINENFAISYRQIAKEQKNDYDACLSYFQAVFYASRCTKIQQFFQAFNVTALTVQRINSNNIKIDDLKVLEITLKNSLKELNLPKLAENYYQTCLETIIAKLKETRT